MRYWSRRRELVCSSGRGWPSSSASRATRVKLRTHRCGVGSQRRRTSISTIRQSIIQYYQSKTSPCCWEGATWPKETANSAPSFLQFKPIKQLSSRRWRLRNMKSWQLTSSESSSWLSRLPDWPWLSASDKVTGPRKKSTSNSGNPSCKMPDSLRVLSSSWCRCIKGTPNSDTRAPLGWFPKSTRRCAKDKRWNKSSTPPSPPWTKKGTPWLSNSR